MALTDEPASVERTAAIRPAADMCPAKTARLRINCVVWFLVPTFTET
jgi:hypothetical protein